MGSTIGRVASITQQGGDCTYTYDVANKPAIVIYNGTAYAYAKNLQGDIVGILDNAGNWVVEYTYDAWGAPTSRTGSMADTLGAVNPFRYRGYVYDQETGLYYLRSRYYHPILSRFINTDALIGKVRIMRHNLYTYCDNKPGKHIDTQGTEPYDLFGSELEAVLDFSACYNNEEVEYAAIIYETKGQFFYAEPQKGTTERVTIDLSPNAKNNGTPVSFVHTHTNDRRKLRAFWPSNQDLYMLCDSTYSHAYLIVPDNSVIKMSKPDAETTAILDFRISAITGGVKEATQGKEMNIAEFEETVSDAYETRVAWWWVPFLW